MTWIVDRAMQSRLHSVVKLPIYVVEEVLAEQGFSEQELDKGQKPDTKDVLQNLDDDTLKQYTV